MTATALALDGTQWERGVSARVTATALALDDGTQWEHGVSAIALASHMEAAR